MAGIKINDPNIRVNEVSGEELIPVAVPDVNEPKACSVNQIFKHFEDNFGIDDVAMFSETKPYHVGNVCRYNNKIYRFKVNHAGPWSDTDVEETSLFSAIETMREEIEAFVGVGNEDITVSCSTMVPGVSVAGLKFMVYFNGSEIGHEYTTDTEGKFVVQVTRNYAYKIVPPSIEECGTPDTIIGFATTSRKHYDVVYSEVNTYNEELTVYMNKYIGETRTAMPGNVIKISHDGTTDEYTTDSAGKINIIVARGTDYEIEFPAVSGLYIMKNVYKFRYKAESTKRNVTGTYSDAEIGAFVVCDNGSEYTIDEFKKKGIDINSARLIKISTAVLGQQKSVFGIGIDDLRSRNYTNQMWQSDNNNQLNSVGNGYHYDGYGNSMKQYEEADARGISVFAIKKCLDSPLTTSFKTYNGFLGSAYQWIGAWNLREVIDKILVYTRPLDGDGNFMHRILNVSKKGYDFSSYTGNKWTSDQSNANNAYYFGSGVNYNSKNNGCAAVPFYAF